MKHEADCTRILGSLESQEFLCAFPLPIRVEAEEGSARRCVLGKIGIFMRIRRSAAAEEAERL